MALTCIIIDDEPFVVQQLTEYINGIPALTLIKSYSNSTAALQGISQMEDSIDILFTDIEMPKLSGLELARKIRHKTKFLILVSGHSKYALDGYNVKANDFLTKPFNFKKFKTIVTAVVNQTPLEKPFIFIKTKENKALIKIWVEEIIYINAYGNYISIHTHEKSLTTLLKISEIEEQLGNYLHFIRIHKSFIISAKHIEKFTPNFMYLNNGIMLSVGISYRDSVKAFTNLIGDRLSCNQLL